MKRLNYYFYYIVIITALMMWAIASGKLDQAGSVFYLGGAGFAVLFYSIRTFLLVKQRESALHAYHLNVIEKVCGYISLINGYIFASIAVILVGVLVYAIFTKSGGRAGLQELIVTIPISLYGYCLIKYCRFTLHELK